ncbi:hypothetical protein DPMN_027757 [Dreissena polymorpha]|uniref:Uncharacterized protein n=1 Tax=Dreissena polymorpha TaxID=45954 RepID=A0A9D4LXN4_DREPO|nr:hypothetical protein DPMN_027757 [Dreissena polymorpha]
MLGWSISTFHLKTARLRVKCKLLGFSTVTVTESPSDVTWVAILTWNQKDGLIRIITNTRGVAINCIQYNKSDEVTRCV